VNPVNHELLPGDDAEVCTSASGTEIRLLFVMPTVGAGKHLQAQLSFARQNGIEVCIGDPADEVPGKSIVLPQTPDFISAKELDLEKLRKSLIQNCVKPLEVQKRKELTEIDIEYLAVETKTSVDYVRRVLNTL